MFDPWNAAILDLREPFDAQCTDVDAIWAVIPRARLRHVGVPPGGRRVHRDSPRGRVLSSAITTTWQKLATARATDAAGLAHHIVVAAESVLAAGDFAPPDSSLATAIRGFIDARLDDLELDGEVIGRKFHCSRSTLYRIFTPYGGITTYIRARRLERCLDELAIPAESAHPIKDVATRWGFENPSHFHRLFTARYGLAPSAVQRLAVRAPVTAYGSQTHRKIQTFHKWALRA
ncbi:helix-turn-helix transcriptional regulator [Agromyces sp. GXQ0307]|uniref:helix-turn-helix transcriptional regulator n=1 Tax=Agromyces sp. GXQ0307 TaxID=3377835 RepID=UPI00383AE648